MLSDCLFMACSYAIVSISLSTQHIHTFRRIDWNITRVIVQTSLHAPPQQPLNMPSSSLLGGSLVAIAVSILFHGPSCNRRS